MVPGLCNVKAGMTFHVFRPTLRSESTRYQTRDNHEVARVQGQGSGKFGLRVGCVWMWLLVWAANYWTRCTVWKCT